jgi:hypothetical protein
MAAGDKEHRMVFDIRGKRRNVVKVVYAILAVLMGLSLFLVTGIGNIGSLFDSGSESGAGAVVYEEQAERIERKLVKSPEDSELLVALTRAQLNAGNQLVEQTPEGTVAVTTESVQKYREASDTWSEYLKATSEPSAGTASLIAPIFVTLAEAGRRSSEFEENMAAASEAQAIVAEQRPSINSLSTLSFYEYFNFDQKAAAKARAEAIALTKTKVERENIENTLDEYKKRAAEVEKQFKEIEAAEKASGAANGQEKLENPFGGLGGTGLGE